MTERLTFADNLVSGNLVASGVQFSTGVGTTVQSVTANKEVILAGGAYGSPHLLQVSGVGPSDILTAANVPVKLSLPGVGSTYARSSRMPPLRSYLHSLSLTID